MDIYRPTKRQGKYPPLVTDSEMKSCLKYKKHSEVIWQKKVILLSYSCNDDNIFRRRARASCSEVNSKLRILGLNSPQNAP